MQVHKIVCIQNSQTNLMCRYFKDWYNIPVFVTCDGKESKSALYKDGTSFFIIGGNHHKGSDNTYMYNRLWHEVAHLFFGDVWKTWDILYEYRADLVAAAATSKFITLNRLYSLKHAANDHKSREIISNRIHHLTHSERTYTRESVQFMLSSLKPVTVLR